MAKIVDQAKGYAGKARAAAIREIILGGLNTAANISNENLARMTYPLEKIVGEDNNVMPYVRDLFETNHPLTDTLRRMVKELNPNAKRGMINWVNRVLLCANAERAAFKKEHGFPPPQSVVISPTMSCNLRCVGCYAGEYLQDEGLEPELLDDILKQCKEMGIGWINFSGGEPFYYPKLLDVIEKNKEGAVFQIYTNSTLIDDEVADRLAEMGNVFPAISLEGFEEETDARRGPGIFRKVMEAMDRLHERGVFFGFSATSTAMNYKAIVTDEFVEMMVDKGAMLGWYFNYIPVGLKPTLDLMPSPEQRNYVRQRVNKLREKYPISLIDFWGDGSLVGGCQSAGRAYFHINSNGDMEPCVFNHFAVDNVREKSLLECLKSPFFTRLREGIPFSENTLRPCPIIDHPNELRSAIRETGARPTCAGADTLLDVLADGLDHYSESVAAIYDDVWEKHEAAWTDWWMGTGPKPSPYDEEIVEPTDERELIAK